MSQFTLTRAHAPRAKQAWIDTGLRYCLTAVCAGSAGVHAALIHLHILALADLLSSGIMHQFPNRFA